MKIVACYKIVRDERDLAVAPDRTVSFDGCALRVGDYDLNALEAGAELAAATAGELVGLTIAGPEARDTKLRKGVLSRGVDAVASVVDPALADADAGTTAQVLAAAVGRLDGCDLVLCGEGSADRYSQQVGAQLAAVLGLPYVNSVRSVEPSGTGVLVERTLEREVETLQVPLPAVLSVTADANTPRIPSMKDILGAAKKPATEWSPADLGIELPASKITLGPERAPASHARTARIYPSGQLQEFFGAVRQLIGKDAK